MITKEEYQKTLIRMWDSVRDDTYKGNPNCDGVDCQNCPTTSVCGSGVAGGYDMVEFVEEWAEEHPIKTNREVFMEAVQEKFGGTLNSTKLQTLLDVYGCALFNAECTTDNCKTCDLSKVWDKEYKEVSKDADSN